MEQNRLLDAWQSLAADDPNNADQVKAIVPACRLFLDWARRPAHLRGSFWQPLIDASPPVREAFGRLRSFAATCSEAEIEEFVQLATDYC